MTKVTDSIKINQKWSKKKWEGNIRQGAKARLPDNNEQQRRSSKNRNHANVFNVSTWQHCILCHMMLGQKQNYKTKLINPMWYSFIVYKSEAPCPTMCSKKMKTSAYITCLKMFHRPLAAPFCFMPWSTFPVVHSNVALFKCILLLNILS